MKTPLILATLLTLMSALSSSQTLVEKLYVMRADTTTVDTYTGMTHICILVFPDGRYRLERSFQGMQGGRPETKVYLDKLSDAEFKALQGVLDESKFQEIKTDTPHGGIVQDMDTLTVNVPREHTLQNFSFVNAAERKPFEKTLKPFFNTLKSIEKRKAPIAKTEASNNCDTPRVMYRTAFTSSSAPPDSDQH